MDFFEKLPGSVRLIIDRMRENGYRADIVGGCVRDFLLGRTPFDFDITTNARPEVTKQLFSDFRVIETGIKHGTVTVLIDGDPYEITTYRIDGEYKDNRRPESVSFSCEIEDDLSRRDFTMNAIAYNPYDGITDRFGGAEDISRGLIRAVGDPYLRFDEDALRILRGVRFSSTLGFEIEEKTSRAILDKCHLLKNISAERILVEFKKLLLGGGAVTVINRYLPVINEFLPEVKKLDLPTDAFFGLSFTEACAMLFFASESDGVDIALRTLRADNEAIAYSASTLKALYEIKRGRALATQKDLGFFLCDYGPAVMKSAVEISRRLGLASLDTCAVINEYLGAPHPYRISDLDIGGNDLISRGYRGKAIGDKLSELLDRVISGEVENTRASLLAAL
ncbi:MAG: CCA tRNA nucleotidyltransferase [Clostridia bacterium]|nr:CCA tRNA nucleotidyltransferase [Clostridia bacterium]